MVEVDISEDEDLPLSPNDQSLPFADFVDKFVVGDALHVAVAHFTVTGSGAVDDRGRLVAFPSVQWSPAKADKTYSFCPHQALLAPDGCFEQRSDESKARPPAPAKAISLTANNELFTSLRKPIVTAPQRKTVPGQSEEEEQDEDDYEENEQANSSPNTVGQQPASDPEDDEDEDEDAGSGSPQSPPQRQGPRGSATEQEQDVDQQHHQVQQDSAVEFQCPLLGKLNDDGTILRTYALLWVDSYTHSTHAAAVVGSAISALATLSAVAMTRLKSEGAPAFSQFKGLLAKCPRLVTRSMKADYKLATTFAASEHEKYASLSAGHSALAQSHASASISTSSSSSSSSSSSTSAASARDQDSVRSWSAQFRRVASFTTASSSRPDIRRQRVYRYLMSTLFLAVHTKREIDGNSDRPTRM